MHEAAVDTRYSGAEELANSLTHGLGLLLSALGMAWLLVNSGGALEVASCLVYGATLVFVYGTSTVYHGVSGARAKQLLRTLDHVAIFLLIAGTYTPFVLIALRGPWGWSLFGVVWSLAVLGAIFEMTRLRRHRRALIAMYVGLGWIGLVALKPLVAALPAAGLWLLFGGGVSYTVGVLFYRWHGLRYHHAIWHVFVLAGSVLQYLAVLWYVLPRQA